MNCLLCGATSQSPIYSRNGFELVRCRGCQLAFIANPPAPEEISKLYSFESGYHADFATDAGLRLEFIRRGEDYLRYLPPAEPGAPLLDVGCSAGFFLKAARERGWTVTGLELNSGSAALGRRLYGLDIVEGALVAGAFEDAGFQAVTLWDVIEHLEDPLAAMRQVRRVLRPGGFTALSTPNIDGLFPRVSHPLARLTGYWAHPEPPRHLFQFSARTLAALLDKAGFTVVTIAHRRIPLTYSFKSSRFVETALFAGFAYIGPWLRMGDEIVVIARAT